MIERVWAVVVAAQRADAAENHRSSSSPTVPLCSRAWPTSATSSASRASAWRRPPWTVVVIHRGRPAPSMPR